MQLVGTRPKIDNFFFNLEIQGGFENTIKNLLLMIKKLQTKHIFRTQVLILRNSFQKPGTKNCDRNGKLFSDVDIQKLSKNQIKLCEEDLTKKDLYNFLNSM